MCLPGEEPQGRGGSKPEAGTPSRPGGHFLGTSISILIFKVLKLMSRIHRFLPLKQCLAPFPLHILGHPLVSILLQVEGQLPWLTVGITTLSSCPWSWQGNFCSVRLWGKERKMASARKPFFSSLSPAPPPTGSLPQHPCPSEHAPISLSIDSMARIWHRLQYLWLQF